MRNLVTSAVLAIALCLPAVAEEPVNPIRLNQAGLLANGPKHAIIPHTSRAPVPWTLLDGGDRPVLQGRTIVVGDDAASGQHLHRVDFSKASATGDGFRLRVGDDLSRPFAIGAGPYATLKRDALAYFYHNRAGTPIEARFVGPARARPAGHPQEIAPCFGGKDAQGNVWPACPHQLNVTGGWYDAGDHGKYVVNGGISLWTLLNLYERQAANGRPASFPDGAAAIPESSNGVNDLLDEARWQMEFMLSMQVPDGTSMELPLGPQKPKGPRHFTHVDVSGMAHHKVADERWTMLPMPPHLDPEPRFLYPPGTAATLNLAATAAQAARIWRPIDPSFADRCLKAASRAWNAALRVPDALAIGDFAGSGGYGDSDMSDEFFWAAAELLATTRQPLYAAVVTGSVHFTQDRVAEPGWAQVAPLGTLSLSLSPDALGPQDAARVRQAILSAADGFVADADGGYRQPLPVRAYTWGSNSSLLNRAIILAYAHDATGEGRYRDPIVDVMDYLLGRNPLDQSYISGYGARPMRHPHHRFWAPSLDPKLPPPPPGVVSGGPNANSMADKIAKQMKGHCAPQTCWADHIDAYALNEVTINWNAPLVWVAAWLDGG